MSVLIVNDIKVNNWKKIESKNNLLLNKKKLDNVLIKTKMCDSILQNKSCRHGNNCRFAHTEDEIEKNICIFGDECKYVEIKGNTFHNKSDIFKKCAFQHPGESDKNFNQRISKKEERVTFIIKPKQNIYGRNKAFDILKDKTKIDMKLNKTKMCLYGNDCPRGVYCRFAHSKDELKSSSCLFGDKCKYVKYNGENIENISKTKICIHKHPNESEENFINRLN